MKAWEKAVQGPGNMQITVESLETMPLTPKKNYYSTAKWLHCVKLNNEKLRDRKLKENAKCKML